MFPLAGHLRRGEDVDLHGLEKGQQFKGLAGRGEVFALPDHIFFLDQLFDDRRPGGRGAEAAFLHGIGEFVVFNQLVGILHGGQQSRLVKARRWCRHLVFPVNPGADHRGLLRNGAQHRVPVLILGKAVNRLPAGIEQDLSLGEEGFGLDDRQSAGIEVDHGREKDRQKSLHHHPVDLQFRLGKTGGKGGGGDNGMVVRYLRVVEDPLVRLDIAFRQGLFGKLAKTAIPSDFSRSSHHGRIIFRQMPAVGPRIGEDLVAFIEGLGDAQGVLGGNAETGVGLTLQGGQVVELGGALARSSCSFPQPPPADRCIRR